MRTAVKSAFIKCGSDCTRCIDEFTVCYRYYDGSVVFVLFTVFVFKSDFIGHLRFCLRQHFTYTVEFFDREQLYFVFHFNISIDYMAFLP